MQQEHEDTNTEEARTVHMRTSGRLKAMPFCNTICVVIVPDARSDIYVCVHSVALLLLLLHISTCCSLASVLLLYEFRIHSMVLR
jgi:hypothetical protein